MQNGLYEITPHLIQQTINDNLWKIKNGITPDEYFWINNPTIAQWYSVILAEAKKVNKGEMIPHWECDKILQSYPFPDDDNN